MPMQLKLLISERFEQKISF